jgi:hypothetical protein
LIKDYDLSIQYTPGKANVVDDALSRKTSPPTMNSLIADFERMDISYSYAGVTEEETQLILALDIPGRMLVAQQPDRLLLDMRKRIQEGNVGDFTLDPCGAVQFHGRLCVPQRSQVKEEILKEAHRTRYTMHPGENKMYQDLKKIYWLKRTKLDRVKYVASCGICQQVKAEFKNHFGKLQSLKVPLWPWDNIAMDFMVGLPRSLRGRDSIWVVIDHLSKVAHFIPIRSTSLVGDLTPIYV